MPYNIVYVSFQDGCIEPLFDLLETADLQCCEEYKSFSATGFKKEAAGTLQKWFPPFSVTRFFKPLNFSLLTKKLHRFLQ